MALKENKIKLKQYKYIELSNSIEKKWDAN
jgi:hypothetical protein